MEVSRYRNQEKAPFQDPSSLHKLCSQKKRQGRGYDHGNGGHDVLQWHSRFNKILVQIDQCKMSFSASQRRIHIKDDNFKVLQGKNKGGDSTEMK